MINKVILMGRLTADPELRQTQSGISCLRCTIAINRQYKADNGERQADFINIVAWRQTAEFISRYFKKGSDFVDAAFSVIEKDVNTQGKYYISATFNEMILNNKNIGVFEIPKKDYLTFSNYQMYEKHLALRKA